MQIQVRNKIDEEKYLQNMAFLVFSVIFPINNHPPAVFRHMIVKHKELAVRSLIFRFYRRKHPENIDFRGQITDKAPLSLKRGLCFL